MSTANKTTEVTVGYSKEEKNNENDLYSFKFHFPTSTPDDVSECLTQREISTLFCNDSDESSINKKISTLITLLLRPCLTIPIALHYRAILPLILAKCLEINVPYLSDLKYTDFQCPKHQNDPPNQTPKNSKYPNMSDGHNDGDGNVNSQKIMLSCIELFAGRGGMYPTVVGKDIQGEMFWGKLVQALGELVPFLPHLRPFATRAFEMYQHFRFYLELITTNKEYEQEIERFLRSLFRLLLNNTGFFSHYIPSPIFLLFFTHKNPMIRSYAIHCMSYIEGWPESGRHKLLLNKNSPSSLVTDALKYFSPDLYEFKLNAAYANSTFKNAISLSHNVLDCSSVPLTLNEQVFTSGISHVSGVLLNKCSYNENYNGFRSPIHALPNSIHHFNIIDSRKECIRQFATAVSLGDSVLLEGPPGSGKTALFQYLTSCLSVKKLLKLTLNGQTDPKTLIGTYISTELGIFEWKSGVLTTAVSEGTWILVENIDTAPLDIVTILSSLLESKFLYIPSMGEKLIAKSGFQIVATCTDSSQLRINKGLWHQILVPQFNDDEIMSILNGNYKNIRNYSNMIMDAYNFAIKVHSKLQAHHGRKLITPRILFKLAGRLDRLFLNVSNNANIDLSKFNLLSFQNTFDCFFAALHSKTDRLDCYKRLAEIYGVQKNLDLNSYQCLHLLNVPLPGSIELFETHIEKRPEFSSFVLTPTAINYLRMIYTSCKHDEPVLMVGETGTGKTTMIQYISQMLGKKLKVINMSRESELSDLLGEHKPINEHKVALETYEIFKTHFGNTFDSSKNIKFINAMDTAFHKKHYLNLVKGFRKALAAAELMCSRNENDQLGSLKALRTDSSHKKSVKSLAPAWGEFGKSVNKLEAIVKAGSSIRFGFIEGKLSKAIKNGDYILLDEVNIASKEVLDQLSILLESNTDSVTLLDKGDSTPIARNPEFRIFACMNPSTDFGKRDLEPVFRSRFTEIWVDSPASNIEELKMIVKNYLKNCLPPSKPDADKIVQDVSEFYIKVVDLSQGALISDPSGMRTVFTARTLFRALSFACQIINYCTIHKAIYEGICLCFLSCLNEKSLEIVGDLLGSEYKKDSLSSIPLKHPHTNVNRKLRPPDNYIKVGPYWLKVGPYECEDGKKNFVITQSVEKNLLNLSRAVACGKYPVLIQGPTSVGKTSIIEYLARKLGHKFVRINNHQHTEIQEYIGTWASTSEDGKFEFVEGALLRSLKYGYWLVLDELNMAPSDVIEALDRLLDDNRELFVAETQTTVKPHPNFMLFATQNPAGSYDGRSYLSRALRNRFIELHFQEVPHDELLNILSERCSIAPSFARRMVNVYKRLQLVRSRSNIFEGRHSFVTLRDLFKWASRNYTSYEELAIQGWFLLGERARKGEDREIIKQILEEEIRVALSNLNKIYDDYSDTIFSQLKKDNVYGDGICFTKAFRRMFTLVYNCVINKEPVLLVGETGLGKTTMCGLIAEIMGRYLHIINVHQNTTTQDFLGGQRPVRTRALLIKEVKEIIYNVVSILGTEVNDLGINNLAEEDVDSALNKLQSHAQKNKNTVIAFERAAELWKKANKLFCWYDGPLVRSMNEGSFLLIDEISLADSSVVERLNSVLEPERTLFIAEKCEKDMSIVKAKDGFSIFATMNPGGDYGKKELSPALRSRFTEIWVPPIDSRGDMEEIINSRLSKTIGDRQTQKKISSCIMEFIYWVSGVLRVTEVGSILSIRDIISWAQFISNTHSKMGLKKAYIHGGHLIFIDGISAKNSFNVSTIQKVYMFTGKNTDFMDICNKKLCDIIGHELYEPSKMFRNINVSIDDNGNKVIGTEFMTIDFGDHHKNELDSRNFYPYALESAMEKCRDDKIISNINKIQAVPALGFSLEARSTTLNLGRLLRAMQLEKAILLEGPPGVGKTSLVSALASLSGHEITRINLSDQTDIMDLFGSDLPTDNDNKECKFSWHDGPLLRALKNGTWVLLDELNLADQNVLEGLNSCLDHRNEIYIPDLDLRHKKAPGFRLFAAQNPQNLGGGRKGLPKSFLNRFTVVYVNPMTVSDEETILKNLFADSTLKTNVKHISNSTIDLIHDINTSNCSINPKTLSLMSRFNDIVARDASALRICSNMATPEFNLRDVVRWARLIQLDSNFHPPYKYLRMLYLHRLRTYEDRIKVKHIYEDVFGYKIPRDVHNSQLSINRNHIRIGCAIYKRSGEILDTGKSIDNLQILSSRLPYMETILKCIQAGYLPLLVGPEGSGKTCMLRLIARFCNKSLVEIPLSPSTDATDLIGSFEQVNYSKHEEEFRRKFSKFIKYITWICLCKGNGITEDIVNIINQLSRLENVTISTNGVRSEYYQTMKIIEQTKQFSDDPTYAYNMNFVLESLNKLTSHVTDMKKNSSPTGSFTWVDGPVTRAIKNGHWIVLENANLCPPSILDRLNSIFEPRGKLLLSERGLIGGEFENISVNDNFRMFMTMDEKYGELSRAMRNRSVELYMHQDIINMESDEYILTSDIERLQMANNVIGDLTHSVKRLYEQNCKQLDMKTDYFSRRFLNFNKVFSDLVNRGNSLNDSVMKSLNYLSIARGSSCKVEIATTTEKLPSSIQITPKLLVSNSEITSSCRFHSALENFVNIVDTRVTARRVLNSASNYLHTFVYDNSNYTREIGELYGLPEYSRYLLETHNENELFIGEEAKKDPILSERLKFLFKILNISNYGAYEILNVGDMHLLQETNVFKRHKLKLRMAMKNCSNISVRRGGAFIFEFEEKKIKDSFLAFLNTIASCIEFEIQKGNVQDSGLLDRTIFMIDNILDISFSQRYLDIVHLISFFREVEDVFVTQIGAKTSSALLNSTKILKDNLYLERFYLFLKLWKSLSDFKYTHSNAKRIVYSYNDFSHTFSGYFCPCNQQSPSEKYKDVVAILSGRELQSNNVTKSTTESSMCILKDAIKKRDSLQISFNSLSNLSLLFHTETTSRLILMPLCDYLYFQHLNSLLDLTLSKKLDHLNIDKNEIEEGVHRLSKLIIHTSRRASKIKAPVELLKHARIEGRICRNLLLDWHIFSNENAFTTFYDVHPYGAKHSDIYNKLIVDTFDELQKMSTIGDYHHAKICYKTITEKIPYREISKEINPLKILMFSLNDILVSIFPESDANLIDEIINSYRRKFSDGRITQLGQRLIEKISIYIPHENVRDLLLRAFKILNEYAHSKVNNTEISKALIYTSFALADIYMSGMIIDPAELSASEGKIIRNSIEVMNTKRTLLIELYKSHLVFTTDTDEMDILESQLNESRSKLIRISVNASRDCSSDETFKVYKEFERQKRFLTIENIENWISILQERNFHTKNSLLKSISSRIESLKKYVKNHCDIVNPVILALYNVMYSMNIINADVSDGTRKTENPFLLPNNYGNLECITKMSFISQLESSNAYSLANMTNGLFIVLLLRRLFALKLINGINSNAKFKINGLISFAARIWASVERSRALDELRKSSLYRKKDYEQNEEDEAYLEQVLPCGRNDYDEFSNYRNNISSSSSHVGCVQNFITTIFDMQDMYSAFMTNLGKEYNEGLECLWRKSAVQLLDIARASMANDLGYSFDMYPSIKYFDILEDDKEENFNIYAHSLTSEIRKIEPFCIALYQKLQKVLENWPHHDTLLSLYTMSQRLLTLSIYTPIPRVLYIILVFLSRVPDWERVATGEDSLKEFISEACKIVETWRKLELSFWRTSPYLEERAYGLKAISDVWFHLWLALENSKGHNVDIKEFTSTIYEYIANSSIGDFNLRLKAIRICLEYLGSSMDSVIISITNNIIDFYSIFKDKIDTELNLRRKDTLSKLKEKVNVNHMKNVVYYMMKESYDDDNRKLLKVLREFRECLSTPISNIISSILPSPLHVRENAQNIKEEAPNLQEVTQHLLSPIATKMSKLFDSQYFALNANFVERVNNVVDEVSELSNVLKQHSESYCKDEKVYNTRKAFRRANLNRLFKSLSTIGISRRDLLKKFGAGEFDIRDFLVTSTTTAEIFSENFFRILAKMNKLISLRQVAHADLSKLDSKMCINIMNNLLNTQNKMQVVLHKSKSELNKLVHLIVEVSESRDCEYMLIFKFDELLEVLHDARSYLEMLSFRLSYAKHILQSECPVSEDIKNLQKNISTTRIEIENIYERVLNGKVCVSGEIVNFINDRDVNVVKDIDKITPAFSNLLSNNTEIFGGWMGDNKLECNEYHASDHYTRLITNLFGTRLNKILDENNNISLENALSEFKKTVLISFQQLISQQNPEEGKSSEISWMEVQSTKRLNNLHVDRMTVAYTYLMSIGHSSKIKTDTGEYLNSYIAAVRHTHDHLSQCIETVSVLSMLLGDLFIDLHISGFNLELKSDDKSLKGDIANEESLINALDTPQDQDEARKGDIDAQELADAKNETQRDGDAEDNASANGDEKNSESGIDVDIGMDDGEFESLSGDSDEGDDISHERGDCLDDDRSSDAESFHEELWDESDQDTQKNPEKVGQDCAKKESFEQQLVGDESLGDGEENDGEGGEDKEETMVVNTLEDGGIDEEKIKERNEGTQNGHQIENASKEGEYGIEEADDMDVDDAGSDDTGVDDMSVEDTGVDDMSVEDAGVEDAGVEDAGVEDAGADNASADNTSIEEKEDDDMNKDENCGEFEDNTEPKDGVNEEKERYSRNYRQMQSHTLDEEYKTPGIDGYGEKATEMEFSDCESKEESEVNKILTKQEKTDDKMHPIQQQNVEEDSHTEWNNPQNEVTMSGYCVKIGDENSRTETNRHHTADMDRISADTCNEVTKNVTETQGEEGVDSADDYKQMPIDTKAEHKYLNDARNYMQYDVQAFGDAYDEQLKNNILRMLEEERYNSETSPANDNEGKKMHMEYDESRITTRNDGNDKPSEEEKSPQVKEKDDKFSKDDTSEDIGNVEQKNNINRNRHDPGIENTLEMDELSNEEETSTDAACSRLISLNADESASSYEERLEVARKLWNAYAGETVDEVSRLNEQLQLILKPVLASRLKGDYKSGKRLNMRKLIPYIASNYRKDRIWLRRTHPNKRHYQIMLCIDDSLSMNEMKCVQLAYKSLVVISRALNMFEVGDIGVASFGNDLKLLHPFGHPFNDEAGARVFTQFKFNQNRTLMIDMMKQVLRIFSQSSHLMPQSGSSIQTSSNNIDMRRLQIIISDGICEDHDKLRTICRLATGINLMTAFIILDTKPGSDSIRNIKNVFYTTDKNNPGKSVFLISKYMETFPFDFFVMINNVEMLPEVLSDVIRQYVELSV